MGNKNVGQTHVYSVKSASFSDGGLYICEAKNQIGTGQSQPVEVKILREYKDYFDMVYKVKQNTTHSISIT